MRCPSAEPSSGPTRSSRRDTAELLGGLDDTALRAASAVLLREPTGPVDREAMVASLLRCDLYLRYHR